METNIKESEAPVVRFDITDAALAKMAAEYLPLKINGLADKGGFAAVHDARMVVRGKRIDVENTRKELKADALAWGKKVDAEAKRITSKLQPIEEHLKAEEEKIKAEKARVKAEMERKEEERIQARLDKLQEYNAHVSLIVVRTLRDGEFENLLAQKKKEWEIEQASLAQIAKEKAEQEEAERKEREAEAARLKEQKAVQDRIDKEQKKQEAALKAEADKIEADRLALAEEKRLEDAKKEAAEQARQDEKDRAEREKKETEERDRRAKEEKARQAALLPDKEKLLAYAEALDNRPIATPSLKDKKAEAIMIEALDQIHNVAEFIRCEVKDL